MHLLSQPRKGEKESHHLGTRDGSLHLPTRDKLDEAFAESIEQARSELPRNERHVGCPKILQVGRVRCSRCIFLELESVKPPSLSQCCSLAGRKEVSLQTDLLLNPPHGLLASVIASPKLANTRQQEQTVREAALGFTPRCK